VARADTASAQGGALARIGGTMSIDSECERIDNDGAADAWLHGYRDAHAGRQCE